MKNNMMQMTQKSVLLFLSVMIAGVFLVGCSDSNEELKASLLEEKTDVNKDSQEDVLSVSEIEDIVDQRIEEAFKNYAKENAPDFGKIVIESANAYQKQQEEEQEKLRSEGMKTVPDIREDEYVLGDRDAKFVLFEYSDVHCPFCQRFHPTTKEFVEKNSDVAVVFRAFPLDQLHPEARGVHEAAECFGELGGKDAFWSFMDAAFADTTVGPNNYKSVAKSAGITDTATLSSCIESRKYQEKVAAYTQEGADLGIQGTPGSILKNTQTGEVQFVGGAYPLDALESLKSKLQ